MLGAGVAQVALGSEFSCARLKTGAVRCWGRNQEGQVGIGTASKYEPTPKPVQWP